MEALEYVAGTKFCKADGVELDLILMDSDMPNMTGPECAQRIRAMEKRKEIVGRVPIVLAYPFLYNGASMPLFDGLFDGVIFKPARNVEVAAMMEDFEIDAHDTRGQMR